MDMNLGPRPNTLASENKICRTINRPNMKPNKDVYFYIMLEFKFKDKKKS
jgi:hypothetical protein